MKILSLCGSIRKESTNQALLKAVQNIFPVQTDWVHFDIDKLPYFDPVLQFGEDVPEVVRKLRQHAFEAQFIVISTPEYAHGIPGILKNALEWLVCEETMKKTVLVFIATSSGGDHVKEYLLETLKTMDMVANLETTFVIKGARASLSKTGQFINSQLQAEVIQFLNKNIPMVAN